MVDSNTALTAGLLGIAVLGMMGFALFLTIGCVNGIKEERQSEQD